MCAFVSRPTPRHRKNGTCRVAGSNAWLIDVAHGKEKVSADLRYKAIMAVHERVYGRPAQNVSVDIALKRAVESKAPVEQLRILRDMRSALNDHLATAPVIEIEADTAE
jgi:hypothetical protein